MELIGAHMTSATSPIAGIAYVRNPTTSITIERTNLIRDWSVILNRLGFLCDRY